MDGLEVAKLLVDKTAMAAAYYLRPMDIGWAVDILRRAAVACVRREIRIAKVYEALDFLEKALDENPLGWSVAIAASFAGIGATEKEHSRF